MEPYQAYDLIASILQIYFPLNAARLSYRRGRKPYNYVSLAHCYQQADFYGYFLG